MRTIVQLSDLHFGRVDPDLLGPLEQLVNSMRPDVLVISGDLTQRARRAEFIAARRFLDRLPMPQIVVPGNHDIPLYNVASRFFTPLVKYRRYIERDLDPVFMDQEVAVLGINTARSLTFKDGRISAQQIAAVRKTLAGLEEQVVKVIVTHHPFDLPEHYDEGDLVGRAPQAMAMFAECGADLLLAGHMHASHAGQSATRYRIGEFSAVVCQAGTATSTRGRGEMNSFNRIRIEASRIEIEQFSWVPQRATFEAEAAEVFVRSNDRWCREAAV
ncbi:MAG: metallophosphoesterase family protein [Janthinobacterium lividum]